MNPLFGLDPNVANTLITAVFSLMAAVIGGVIAALATRKATERALTHSLTMEKVNRRAVLRGVLLGIRTELEVLFEIYRVEMESEIESLKEGQGIHVTLPIYENVFTVYESNCSLIGQLDEDELRKSIIRTYLLAKSLVNAHTYNNKLLEDYAARVREEASTLVQNNAFARIQDYGAQVKATYEEANKSLIKCFALMSQTELLLDEGRPSTKAFRQPPSTAARSHSRRVSP